MSAVLNNQSLAPYAPPSLPGPIDLRLDANEASVPVASIADVVRAGSIPLERYPDARPLEALIASRLGAGNGLSPSQVLVTAGGDDAIDRVCRVCLGPGREIVIPVPTFEMISRSATLAGGAVREVAWRYDERSGGFPLADVIAAVGEWTGVLAVVSPNNPTGATVRADDLATLSAAAPRATLLVDLAYTEFADEDLTAAALALPNAVVVRTFSKAYGLAGLRVGYAAGPESVIRAMRAAGGPFPTSSVSLAVAERAFTAGQKRMLGGVEIVRGERVELLRELTSLGAVAYASQGNFVLARTPWAEWIWRALGGLGISVRRFAGKPGLEDTLRITCPGDATGFARLVGGLRAALRPEAVVLALSEMLTDHGLDKGSVNDTLRTDIGASVAAAARRGLERLASRVPVAIVAEQRPIGCESVLGDLGLRGTMACVVCASDGFNASDTARAAMQRLGAQSAWMVVATPEGVRAARTAGAVPIGLVPPGPGAACETDALERAGAARVVAGLDELLEMLP